MSGWLFREFAPDGVVLDRFAEFTLERTEALQQLFFEDDRIYSHAVPQFIQHLAFARGVAAGVIKGGDTNTDKLKAILQHNGLYYQKEYWSRTPEALRESAGEKWVARKRVSIAQAFNRGDVQRAFLDHLRRELVQNSARLTIAPIDLVPANVLTFFVGELKGGGPFENDARLATFLQGNVYLHCRVFGEYNTLFLAAAQCDYVPSRTRAALALGTRGSTDESRDVVEPYVALKILKAAKRRSELLERTMAWRLGGEADAIRGELYDFRRELDNRQNGARARAIDGLEAGLIKQSWRLVCRSIIDAGSVAIGDFLGAQAAPNPDLPTVVGDAFGKGLGAGIKDAIDLDEGKPKGMTHVLRLKAHDVVAETLQEVKRLART